MSEKTKLETIKTAAEEIHGTLGKIGYSQSDIHLIAEILSAASQAIIIYQTMREMKGQKDLQKKERK